MKFSYAVIVALLIAAVIDSNAQDVCARAREVLQRLNGTHLYPLEIDDSLSARLFDEYFHTLDPEGDLLTTDAIKELDRFRFRLDDELSSSRCEFLDASRAVYTTRLKRVRVFADSMLRKPLVLDAKRYAATAGITDVSRRATEKDLMQKLAGKYQLDILGKMYEQSRGSAPDPSLEPKARESVRQSLIKSIDRALNDEAALRSYTETSFLKTLPRTFDPHSEFFSQEEMEAFEGSLNPEALSFGIELEDTRWGEVSVVRLAPGGPAWNSSQIHEGDILVAVTFDDAEEYDVREMDAVETTALLNLPEKPSAKLTFRTTGGLTRVIALQKSKIENTDNLVSGLVLKGKHTFGYISLPSFYTATENEIGHGCANDVAKEILKLKREKIEGLILDLRFNGGGSIKEAIDLAGIFIDVGPLAIIEMRGEQPMIIKDMTRGLAYDGPLIVMISKASASASELVAAALQDHKRAVIVGSNSYGKATGQLIVPVNEQGDKASFLKVTHERLYRITGASLQQSGLQVDFELPDVIQALLPGEVTLRYAMLPITTNKKTYYQPYAAWKPNVSPELVKASMARIAASEGFEAVAALKAKLREPIPLESALLFDFLADFEKLTARLSQASNRGGYTVANSMANEQVFAVDKYHHELSEKHKAEIESSIYVQEVCHILEDLLKHP